MKMFRAIAATLRLHTISCSDPCHRKLACCHTCSNLIIEEIIYRRSCREWTARGRPACCIGRPRHRLSSSGRVVCLVPSNAYIPSPPPSEKKRFGPSEKKPPALGPGEKRRPPLAQDSKHRSLSAQAGHAFRPSLPSVVGKTGRFLASDALRKIKSEKPQISLFFRKTTTGLALKLWSFRSCHLRRRSNTHALSTSTRKGSGTHRAWWVSARHLPSDPHQHYEHDGWQGYALWLGTSNGASNDQQFLLFDKALIFVRALELKSAGRVAPMVQGQRAACQHSRSSWRGIRTR